MLMDWALVRSDSQMHVIPCDDLRPHECTAKCWCHPSEDDEEPSLHVHHSMDGRERHEMGAPLH